MSLPLACRVSAEKSVYNLVGVPLSVTDCFFLDAFSIFSLPLIFAILFITCLDVDLFGFICLGLSEHPGPGCLFIFPR